MLYSDLNELKVLFEIDPRNTNENAKLLLLLEQASSWISELLNVATDIGYQTRTEFYQGTGTQKLPLRHRPVFPAQGITVSYDSEGFFGQSSNAFNDSTTEPFPYGSDYTLQIDFDSNGDGVDDASKSGILFRINDYWLKPYFRQTGLLAPFVGEDRGSYKIQYTAGYTVDSLPAQIRSACNFLVAKLRSVFPLGVELGGESYEDRSISIISSQRSRLLLMVWPLILPFRNWKW